MNSIKISLVLLILTAATGSTSILQAADVLVVEDNPQFQTNDASLWGPGSGVTTETFKADIIDFADQGTLGGIFNGNYETQPANLEGAMQFICAAGDFLDLASGNCYTCPEGFAHNPVLGASTSGVCFKVGNFSAAVNTGNPTFICPAGQFPDVLTGDCYSCPSGYSHNPALPASFLGVCYKNNNTTATQTHAIGCNSGEFDGLNGYCYTCPSGYDHQWWLSVGTSGVCHKSGWTENRTMAYCGYRKWDSCDWKDPVFGTCWGGWDYYKNSCRSTNVRSGNNYYDCDSGFSHAWWESFNNNGICYKSHSAVNTTATKTHAFGCTGNDFNGLDGNCYECPAGYSHNPLLPVGTSGVCYQSSNTTASLQGDVTFVCPSGEFLDLVSGQCHSCPSPLHHNPAFPASVPGVCFEKTDLAADYVGTTEFFCPAGQIPDAVSGQCFTCPTGYNWNPLVPVGNDGICSKLTFSAGSGGSFELGFEADYDVALRWGVSGGVSVDHGSVTIDYQPAVKVELVPPAVGASREIVTVKTSQHSDLSSLSLSSTWPGRTMWLDTYVDAKNKLDLNLAFIGVDEFGIPAQQHELVPIFDSTTGGEKTLGADPLVELYAGVSGLNLSVLGQHIFGYTGGFNPPFEIAKPVAKLGTLKAGYVVVEFGLDTPDLATPAGSSYKGDHGSTAVLGSGASDTSITNWVAPGSRQGFNLGVAGPVFKDTDVGRFDVDLDGLVAVATNQPLGVKVSQMSPIPLVDFWSVSASVVDLDTALIFGFQETLNFKPNLHVTLKFSKPVKIESIAGSGVFDITVNSTSVPLGDDLRLLHPGGDLTIDTEYSLANNLFTNDTDLVMSPLFEGELASLDVRIIGVDAIFKAATGLPTNISAAKWGVDLTPEPVKLANMTFSGDPAQDTIEYSINSFAIENGGQLSLKGRNAPPVALCKPANLALSSLNEAELFTSDVDNGSNDPDAGDSISLSLSQALFSCSDLGENSITLTATDLSEASDSCTTLVTVADIIAPEGPTVTSYTGTEGDPVFFSSAGSTDGCGTLDFLWQFDPATMSEESNPNHTWCDNGAYSPLITVTDGSGNETHVPLSVDIANVIPSLNAGIDLTVNEGDLAGLSGGIYSDPGQDTHSAAIDWGDLTGVQAGSISINPPAADCSVSGAVLGGHIFADNGSFNVTATVTDDDGGTSVPDTLVVTVLNVDPTAAAGADATTNEGSAVNFAGSFTDPGTADTHTFHWDFGDGATATGSLTPQHIYADNGVYTVTLTVTDDDGGVGTDQLIVTVNNVAPVLDVIANMSIYSGETASVAAPFSDAGIVDTHTAVINWGEGTPEPALINETGGSGTASASHAYYPIGTFTATLVLTDKDGDTANRSFSVEVKAIPVTIDIKPGNRHNKINLSSHGVVPVAIFSNNMLDAEDIDVSSLVFGPGGVHVAHDEHEDGREKGVHEGKDRGRSEDEHEPESILVHFRIRGSGLTLSHTSAGVTGLTEDGRHLVGADYIKVIAKDSDEDKHESKNLKVASRGDDHDKNANDGPGKGKD